jgi:hypothetical protein
VRLAALQRVVRAQRFEGADSFAHFEVMGLVTAGRGQGDLHFERNSAVQHITFAAEGSLEVGADSVRIDLTDFREGSLGRVSNEVRRALSGLEQVQVVERPDRKEGRGYYKRYCFKASAIFRDHQLEIADGVWWTGQRSSSRTARNGFSSAGLGSTALPFPFQRKAPRRRVAKA